MCGRFSLATSPGALAAALGLPPPEPFLPRFNIAPGQAIRAVISDGATLRWEMATWGLVPAWQKLGSPLRPFVNARSEEIFSKPAFRSAVGRRRCLIPVDSFYEWSGKGASRQPYRVQRADGAPFELAGIYEPPNEALGSTRPTCAILTTAASGELAAIHDRMPLVIQPEAYDRHLDPTATTVEALHEIWTAPPPVLRARAVSRYVNDARHEGAQCWEAP